MSLHISQWMVPKNKVICCYQKADLKTAAGLMVNNKIGSVVVMSDEGKNPVGFVSQYDLLNAAYLCDDFKQGTVADIMSTNLVTIDENTAKDAAATMIMEKKIHHLLVVNKDKEFVGLLSALDVARETALDAKAWPYNRGFLESLKDQDKVVVAA